MEQLELFETKERSYLEKLVSQFNQTRIGRLAKNYWEVPIIFASALPWTFYGNIYGDYRADTMIFGPILGLTLSAGQRGGDRFCRDFLTFVSTWTLGTTSFDTQEGIILGLMGSAALYGANYYDNAMHR